MAQLEVALARTNPALAVLSALCHRDQAGVEESFPALAEAATTADEVVRG